jgi:hypothetical protein
MMACLNMEVPTNEIWVPSIEYMKDGLHPFLIGCSQISITQLFTGEGQEESFLHQHCSTTSS